MRHLISTGHVAKLIGMPTHARHVGQGVVFTPPLFVRIDQLPRDPAALKWLSPDATPPVPWHRVISAAGTISSRGPGTTGAQRQRDALEAEGVEVTDGRTGDMRVDLVRWGWFPAPGTVVIGEGG